MENLLWLVLPLALAVGFFFLWLFAKVLSIASDAGERQTKAEEYEAEISPRQLARTRYLENLLWHIKANPQSAELWQQYLTLEATEKELTRQERNTLVNMQTVIDDQTQYELDHGINPYADEQPEPRTSKRRNLGWQD
jgi:hypothetical protein